MIIEANESELALRAIQRDGDAWEVIVQAHQEPVFRLSYLLIGDADEAEDNAQETFVRAWRALDRYDTSRPLRPWLLSIAGNLARNRRRSLGRYFNALRRALVSEPPAVVTVEERSQQRGHAQELWKAVQQLSLDHQQVIYLRYFLEMSVEESAQAVGVAPGTVKSRLYRALEQLRRVVDAEYPGLKDVLE